MSSSTKLWAIGWICIVMLFSSSTGWVWPVCLTAAIVAVALAPAREDDE